jgi:glutamate transport system substrate-binding protein
MRTPRYRSLAIPLAAVATAVAVVVAAVTAVAEYRTAYGEAVSITDRPALVIGVADDQPGLGQQKNGTREGFDIAVATFVAGKLGVRHTFRTLTPGEREGALRDGTVDMVVATFSITPERKERVTFAGPYYVAHQDILVRARDLSIRNVRDLRGRRLCQVPGSNSWRRVTEELGVPARLVPSRSYGECVAALTREQIDAVSTDDLILAGFAARSPTTALVNAPFTDERYGIGLRKGDAKGCTAINRILTEMYQSGAAKTMLLEWFGLAEVEITTTVPQFEGCA